ncbi:MAG: CBS domain-containing protein [Myxococcota bacterium]
MKGKIRQVLGAMTPFPHNIRADAMASEAAQTMRELDIRHLPVVEGETIVGLLSRRELDIVGLLGGLMDQLQVGQLCTRNPYVVDVSARLDTVVEEMSRRKIGSALVLQDGKLAGILTTTDVCRILAETLRMNITLPPDGD